MNTLIRVEDRYGVASLAQQMCMLLHEDEDIEALGYKFENDMGITSVLKVQDSDFRSYYDAGIRRILFVFDLDSDNVDKYQLINVERLSDILTRLEDNCVKSGAGIRLEYIPTVYMAETLALYQEIGNLGVLPELCVNRYSFKVLQASLLRVLFQLKSERDVKRFPEYLIPDKIITAANLGCSVFNARLFEILLNLETRGYNKEEALRHCAMAVQLFDACVEASVSVNLFGHEFNSNMTKEEMRQQVTDYLISIGKKQRRLMYGAIVDKGC